MIYSKNVISIDIGKLNENWKVEDKEYGSIIFYIQGPKNENEDGTVNDIRINISLVDKTEYSASNIKNIKCYLVNKTLTESMNKKCCNS